MVDEIFHDFRHASPLFHAECTDANQLVANYYYLCSRGARKFARSCVDRGDLEQVAALGLIKASRRYDPAMQIPFEPYAWLMVVGELMHYVRDHERAVRIPRTLRALESRLSRAHETCLARLDREPSEVELADELGVVVTTLAELRHARRAACPLAIDDATASNLPRVALGLEDQFLVEDAFAGLSRIERRVIAGVYLLGLKKLELGRRLGISAKRVSRIQHAALAQMQRAIAS